MVYSTMFDGIIHDALWYNICHAKDFGDLSESLWKTLRKTLATSAKDFRTPMFIPRSVNVCTIAPHHKRHTSG